MFDPAPAFDSIVLPLQSASAPSGLGELAVILGGVVTLVLGIAIASVAFRGYRRNDSRPMLFIAIGFVLVIALPGTINYLFYALIVLVDFQPPVGEVALAAVMQASQILGMAAILYALLMR